MDRWSYPGLGALRGAESHPSEPPTARIVPFGPYGGGQYTSHPIGLFIAVGFIVMGIIGIPEARWFFAGSLVLGGILGMFFRLRHRSKSFF
jgi:hypothetical protein